MTQKELLYVEDALQHEKTLLSVINETISRLEDDDLKDFMDTELETHQKIHNKLIKLLEVEVNE